MLAEVDHWGKEECIYSAIFVGVYLRSGKVSVLHDASGQIRRLGGAIGQTAQDHWGGRRGSLTATKTVTGAEMALWPRRSKALAVKTAVPSWEDLTDQLIVYGAVVAVPSSIPLPPLTLSENSTRLMPNVASL